MSESGSSNKVCEFSRDGEAGVDGVDPYIGPEESRRRNLPIEGR